MRRICRSRCEFQLVDLRSGRGFCVLANFGALVGRFESIGFNLLVNVVGGKARD